jgi:hypothetical protein
VTLRPGDDGPTYVVTPDRGHIFYRDLAERVFEAMSVLMERVELRTPAELPENLADARLVVVNPVECALSGDFFIRRAATARSRIMALAESAQTRWYSDQFKLGLDFDVILDIGFTRQHDLHRFSETTYRFVFNGLSPGDEFPEPHEGDRPLPWAFVGHATAGRARLAAALIAQVSPAGFVFLPALTTPGAEGRLGSEQLHRVLHSSVIYVWCAHHPHRYYESFRFRDALLAGAIPCKIDPNQTERDAPCIFGSVTELTQVLETRGVDALREDALTFYTSHGTFTDRVEGALRDVLC